jgi:hypothetical protein
MASPNRERHLGMLESRGVFAAESTQSSACLEGLGERGIVVKFTTLRAVIKKRPKSFSMARKRAFELSDG